MHWLLEPFRFEFMQKALLGCLLIGFTNGYLSAFIVLRRYALLADALSHSLLPGVAIGVLIWGLQPMGLFVGALVAALLVVVGGKMISRSSRVKDDTSIGALYIIAFAIGIILLKYSPVRVDLGHFLFGNVLGLSNMDLWLTYALSSIILLILTIAQRHLLLVLFDSAVALSLGIRVARLDYLLIALMVIAMISSLQAVGIVLSLGLLILPAATIYLLSDSFAIMVWGGASLGAGGAVAGLMLSYWADLPSGPSIVLVLGLAFVLAYLFGPRYGIIPRYFRPRHLHEESLKRWNDPAA